MGARETSSARPHEPNREGDKRVKSRTMIFYLFLKYVNRLKMLVAHVDVRYIRGIFRKRACVWQNKEFSQACLSGVSAFARKEERVRGLSETEERTRAAGTSECEKRFPISRLHTLAACHEYLTRENMGWDDGIISCLVSDLLASIVAKRPKIFRISFFYEATISVLRVLCFCVHVRDCGCIPCNRLPKMRDLGTRL